MNSGASWPEPETAKARVLEIQRKLHKWAKDGESRRFSDLHNLVCDPATLMAAWTRVRANRGSRSAGIDGLSAHHVETVQGVERFLGELRQQLRSGTYRPVSVRERLIPKRGGKHRRLGIPTVTDRVVQAALKLVLEPIFEADFQPCSYGFRPRRRAQDAIAEICLYTRNSYEWVVEADIKACFDELDHTAILGRVRRRVADKRVLALIKAFLKAGIMTEQGGFQATATGTPQGGILSPLLANIALSALDDHFAEIWENFGSRQRRGRLRAAGEATYRLVRYADDFVILVSGSRRQAEALVSETAGVIAPLGLTLSQEKTCVVHVDQGFDFLGWRIKRQQGRRGRPEIYTYPSRPSLMAVKSQIRTITTSDRNQPLGQLLSRLNPVLRGWCNYYRHGVSSATYSYLSRFTWRRVIRWLRRKHPKASWRYLRHRYLPRWWPVDGEIQMFEPEKVRIIRYLYRGSKIPSPWEAVASVGTNG